MIENSAHFLELGFDKSVAYLVPMLELGIAETAIEDVTRVYYSKCIV